jgi:ribosomal protein S7
MPRKGPAPRRPIENDPVYGSQLVTQLINKVLVDGKKQVAERIVHTALEGCRDKTGSDPVVTLKRALDNVKHARTPGQFACLPRIGIAPARARATRPDAGEPDG